MNEFFIITIEGRRRINNLLTLVSTGVYKVSIEGFNFKDLRVDEVLGTEVFEDIAGGSTLYSYYFDIENQEIQVRLNASDLTDKKNFIISHVVAITNDKDIYWHIDPDDTDTRKIVFESRLKGKNISFSQQQENNIVGILTTSLTAITLDSPDQFFNKFVTKNDSFKDSLVKIWKCELYPQNRTPYYKGYVSRITVSDTVVISINDFFKVLDTPYYSRESAYLSSSKSLSGDFPDSRDLPIFRAVGRNTFYKWQTIDLFSGLIQVFQFGTSAMPEAVCNSYNPSLSETVNRGWVTGIMEGATYSSDSYTILSGFSIAYETWFIELTSGFDDFTVGDTMLITSGGFSNSALVYGYGADPNQYVIQMSVGFVVPTAGATVQAGSVAALVLAFDSEEYNLKFGTDYTVASHAVDSPIPITLRNNLETSYSLGRAIDPTKDRIYYKLRRPSNLSTQNHGEMIKNILLTQFDTSELDITSFEDADLILDLQLNFQTPLAAGAWPTKKEILQVLLSSSLGYLYINSEFKIAYGVYTESADDDDTSNLSDIEIEKGTLSHEVDYEDCFASVTFVHQYMGNDIGARIEITDEAAQALHRSSKTFEIPTFTEINSKKIFDIVSGHLKRVAGFLTNPKIKSKFSSLDYRALIGEKKTITSLKSLSFNNATVVSTGESIMRQDLTLINLNEMEGNATVSVNGSTPEEI